MAPTLNHARFLEKFQIATLEFKGIAISTHCCPKVIYYFDLKFKTCIADMLMFVVAKSQKNWRIKK